MTTKVLNQIVPGGAAESDDQRHCRVRVGFMRELVTDPRVAGVFIAIDDETQLLAAAKRYAELAEQLATLAGLPNRLALDTLPPADVAQAIDRLEPTDTLRGLVDGCVQLRAVIPTLYARVTGPQLAAHLVPFVRDTLQLRWQWVVDDLMARYEQLFWGFTLGTSTEMRYVVQVNVDQPFEWRAGETFDQARDRQQSAAAAAHDAYASAKHHRDSPQLELWGTYICRVTVKQHSKRKVARDYQTWRNSQRQAAGKGALTGDRRKDIYDALAEGERLLSLKP